MPLVNKQPFKPIPIPDNLGPDDEVFYLDITNEIFTSHDAFFDRFLYCNSLIWTCGRTGKSGLTYKEALDSEQQETVKKKKGKREKSEVDTNGGDGTEIVKKKKKKYPYDPKKYSMPVPEGFDPSLLTPTGKIDGRKLKSKKNKLLAEELLSTTSCQPNQSTASAGSSSESPKKKGKQQKKKEDEAKRKEEEARKKEEEAKKKAQLQAELAKERELEAKRKKEAAALAKQLERQKKEEERKKATAFLQNWEKKCEDLERDDLRILPRPTPLVCDIPERLFGDAIFILESLYNLHELHNFNNIFPDGLSYDTLEEMLIDQQEEGPLGTVIQFLLRLIFDIQPTSDGYNLDDDPTTVANAEDKQQEASNKTTNNVKGENADMEEDHNENETNGFDSEPEEEDEDDENEDKDVNMNDLIGSAIKAAQEVKKSLSKPLPEMELNSINITDILRLHLLQSGSFPRGRTIYNGWYSSREDPGLWLCMQEPDLIKKLGEVTIYDLELEERIKILHTLIYQLFSFRKTRTYIESASEQLTELRKEYRHEAATFARWDRENCVKRMQPPKRKSEQQQNTNQSSEKPNGQSLDKNHLKPDHNHTSNPCSIDGDAMEGDCEDRLNDNNDKESNNTNQQLKSCLKTNGTSSADVQMNDNDDIGHSKKKITFKTGMNGAIDDKALEDCEGIEQANDEKSANGAMNEDSEHTFEELERAYQQNLVDYEDYQRERAIRYEQLNQTLITIRTNLRMNQAIYGVHPIGRDRAYRRYWVFESLPGLFVEQDDDYVGKCLPNPTPLESRYKKLFNKENPLMHPNEADLIRTKTCDVACSTDTQVQASNEVKIEITDHPENEQEIEQKKVEIKTEENGDGPDNEENSNKRHNGEAQNDLQNQQQHQDGESSHSITDEMNYCTGDENTCAIHGKKRPSQPRWWFYHKPELVDNLIECLNKRGYRESELHDVLLAESSIIKPRVADCPAHKFNKSILDKSGIRRSRRLKTKGSKRRGRKYDQD